MESPLDLAQTCGTVLAGKGGSVEHIVGPFYGPLKEISPAGTSGLITNTVRPARDVPS
jgi:hypothetical protein